MFGCHVEENDVTKCLQQVLGEHWARNWNEWKKPSPQKATTKITWNNTYSVIPIYRQIGKTTIVWRTISCYNNNCLGNSAENTLNKNNFKWNKITFPFQS